MFFLAKLLLTSHVISPTADLYSNMRQTGVNPEIAEKTTEYAGERWLSERRGTFLLTLERTSTNNKKVAEVE